MYLILKSYSKNNIFLLIYKHRSVVPICKILILDLGKNIKLNVSRCYKSFGLKSSLNTAIIIC